MPTISRSPCLRSKMPPPETAANDHDAIAEQLQQAAEGETKTPKKATGGRKRKTATPAADRDQHH